jgi:hypothetical protein
MEMEQFPGRINDQRNLESGYFLESLKASI